MAEQPESQSWRIDGHIVVCPSHYEELYLNKGKELPSFEYVKPYKCFHCVGAASRKSD